MPRPKRAKVTPSKPISVIATVPKKPQLELSISPASGSVSSSRGATGSDDSEGIVTKSKTATNRRGVAPMEAMMSGALAVEDAGEKRPKPLSSRKRIALSRIAREGDYAKAYEDLKAGRESVLGAEKEANNSEVQIQSTQMAGAAVVPIALSTAPLHTTITSTQSSHSIQGAKTQATPLRESSILAIGNFKRRPRQPSLLQIAQAQTAAAESDIDDILDDFAPDDESTPLHKSHSGPQQEHSSTSSSGQPSSRKRKLSTPEVQVPASQSQVSPVESSPPGSSPPDNLFDIVADDSQPNLPLPIIPSSKSHPHQEATDSETLAPPQSSSPPASPQKQRHKSGPRATKSQKRSKPNLKPTTSKNRKQLCPILNPRSPSPTQSSPINTSATRSPLKPITTSALQNLLPRRRRVASRNKENNVFDLASSSPSGPVDEDEDELSYHASHKPGGPTTKVKRGRSKQGVGSKVKERKGETKRVSMTYTRKAQNAELDGENDELESDADENVESRGGGSKMDGRVKEEMKRMRFKFQEVDEWGLEFEEVTGSSDRMRDAR
ncbi:MAG: hypothetical protein Q9179_003859 [Wetmoreana sp. 5 TL-2023]